MLGSEEKPHTLLKAEQSLQPTARTPVRFSLGLCSLGIFGKAEAEGQGCSVLGLGLGSQEKQPLTYSGQMMVPNCFV